MGQTLDRNSPIPAYYQIELDLKERITKKEWDINDRLPSEAELSAQYDVSRVTIRQALAELEKDGIIKKQRGKGAFVSANPQAFIHDLDYSIISGEKLNHQGFEMHAKVLELQVFTAPRSEVYENLEISPDSPVVYIKRLFQLDDRPIAISDSWLPISLTPGLQERGLIDGKLSKTLNTYYQLVPERITDYLEVLRPTNKQALLLNTTTESLLILLKGISYLKDDTPLEFSNTFWLGDVMRFKFQLHATEHGFEIDN
jgi:GntR family transcriptional regulator